MMPGLGLSQPGILDAGNGKREQQCQCDRDERRRLLRLSHDADHLEADIEPDAFRI
jgi:hypothetical protein